jgi:hypothetical protein
MKYLLLALLGCASSGPAVDPARLESLDYEVPAGWKSRDVSTLQNAMTEWTPDGDNDRKESIVIARAEQPALAAPKNRGYLRRDLVEAANHLVNARFNQPTSFVTRNGLSGLRVDGSFTPLGQTSAYHRIHAVLVDGTSLVHVLYTARDPDREHIEAVLDGLKPGA